MLLYQQLKVLSEIISTSLSDGEKGERVDEPVAIPSDHVERVVFEKPWKVVIVLRNGVRIAVEPDFYSEIRGCDPKRDDDSCYLENLYLKVYRDGDGEEVEGGYG